ncbi:hypothetical protein [Pandoraea sp. NPDC090278]|uniref:hypothetical protein n=1 Tax=Pandoraea sp. NPDC090278 TaxID=3364391 RepID=UPI00383B021C
MSGRHVALQDSLTASKTGQDRGRKAKVFTNDGAHDEIPPNELKEFMMEISPTATSPNTLAAQTETNTGATTPQNQTHAEISASLTRASQTGSSIETGHSDTRTASRTDAPVQLKALPITANADEPTNADLNQLRKTLKAIKMQIPDRLSKEWTQLFLMKLNTASPLSPKTLGVFFDAIQDFPRTKQEKDAKSSMIATEKVFAELVSPKGNPFDEGTVKGRVGEFFSNIYDKAVNLETANHILNFASSEIKDRPETCLALITGLWGKYSAIESTFAPELAARIVAFEMSLVPKADRYNVWKHALGEVGQGNPSFSPSDMSRFVNALSSNPPDKAEDIASAHADIAKILYAYPRIVSRDDDQIRLRALEGFLKGIATEEARASVTEKLTSHIDLATIEGKRWKGAIVTVTNSVSTLFNAENKERIRNALNALAGA